MEWKLKRKSKKTQNLREVQGVRESMLRKEIENKMSSVFYKTKSVRVSIAANKQHDHSNS